MVKTYCFRDFTIRQARLLRAEARLLGCTTGLCEDSNYFYINTDKVIEDILIKAKPEDKEDFATKVNILIFKDIEAVAKLTY